MFSKTLFFLLIVNFVSDTYGQKDKKFFRKDYTYKEAFQSFYKFHTIPQTWTDAKRVCALEGATFWHPENDNEANALLSFWNKTKPKIEWIYVGISDLLVEGAFETVDGKSISEVYNNWQPGQPDNYGEGQDCVYMYLKEGPGYLDDYACDKKYSFICKKTLQSLEWNYQCNLPNLDYSYNKDNGKCYKLHTSPLSWTEAYAACKLEQSYLAVISNSQETDYLVKLTDSTPKPRIKGEYQRGIYHLGFHNRFNEGWQTVKGKRLNVDQEAWFDNYQPDGDNHGECGSMFFNGRFINTACEMKAFFICEHDGANSPAAVTTSLSGSEQPILQPFVGGGIEK
uniref:IML1 n=1 Tax=Mythimna separata TaxID=271217 RepID=A0A8F3HLP2_MYTSE|nr:IML1 [Mythimna separata]